MENKLDKVKDILNMFEFFYGQRAGRELWADKPVEIQNQDIDNFVKNIKYIKDFLNDSVVLSKELLEINDIKSTNELIIISRPNLMTKLELKEKEATKATIEKCVQIPEDMRVPEDGRHEWRDHHNDTLDRCKARLTREFEINQKGVV